MPSHFRRPLRHALPTRLGADFAWLWSASAVSNVGDGALLAAGPLLVLSLTDEPAAVAAAVFVQQLPWLLFAVLSGVWVDRLDRRRLVIAVDTCRGAVLASLTAVVATHSTSLWQVYVALFLLGIGETLADNATGALIATSVKPSHLGRANARLYLTFTVGNQLVGPPIGALLFAGGAALPLGLDAVSFLVAAVLVARTTAVPRPEGDSTRPRRGLLEEAAEGLACLRRHPALRALTVCIFVMNVTFTGAFAAYVLYARDRLGLTSAQFGLLITAGAVGGIAGTAVYGRLESRVSVVTLLRVGLLVETATHLVLAVTRSPLVAGATMAVFGVHAVVWGVVATTTRQRATPPALLGRVASVYLLASTGGSALGALLGGLVAQGLGLTAPFWLAFAAMALVTAVAWRPLATVRPRP